ncbi:PAAR domain-containing protein [Pseudomonas petrae]|uniref:PAAR domain-containing protein n=1 Tax=Pseudomonas petrae TaxID=2912190 RepID=A0ABS9IA36_9PSED|nr:PAAR domain-containing protein [Pseudomonas petrae]MCF7534466.1 PAAR domain-containing protein [Pseudomonas petrae]MCF7539932.1 PAAR domain-containing protein [Pseudomonas petrae]MCF7544084.1 PAAR domain-containing protein [Pseudomonas petrae]MCF7558250.1 PAAR domain-containing protein [Pseudomonas petrae]
MTYVVREGDLTTTGGVVLNASGSHTWEDRRLARMGDPVWCERCAQIGFIAQGNPTFIDELVAVATHGQAVRCGCAEGTHRLIASQDQLQADMDATIDIPKDMAEKARKRARHMTRARRESHAPLT